MDTRHTRRDHSPWEPKAPPTSGDEDIKADTQPLLWQVIAPASPITFGQVGEMQLLSSELWPTGVKMGISLSPRLLPRDAAF